MRARKKRGIGTVIASAVMIFLMVFTIGQLYIYSIDESDNYNKAASQAFATQSQKLNEHLSIQSLSLDTSQLVSQDILATAVISNTGGATSQIVDVWFDEVDTPPYRHTVVPQSGTYVGQGLSATVPSSGPGLDTGILYSTVATIKMTIITALGNSVSTTLLPPGKAGTTAQTLATVSLTLVPPNPITSNDLVALLTVTNNNQLGAAFTNLKPDICINEGSSPVSYSSCAYGTNYGRASNQICDVGGGLPTTYQVACTFLSGQHGVSTGSGTTTDTCTVSGSTDTCVVSETIIPASATVFIYTSWGAALQVTSSSSGGSFSVGFPTSQASPGTSFSWSLAPSVSPGTLSFLPYGSTAIFQWIFEVDTLTPDQPITVQASYTSLSTPGLCGTAGACGTGSPAQVATSTAIIRGAGGASSSTGGNFQTSLGSLVLYFPTFEFSQDTSPSQAFTAGFSVPHSGKTIFQVEIGNIGSVPIVLNLNTVMSMISLSGGGGTAFFVVQTAPCTVTGGNQYSWFGSNNSHVCAYPGTGYSNTCLQPGQQTVLYFGANNPGATSSNGAPSAGPYAVIFGMVGYSGSCSSTTPYGQSLPFPLIITT